MLFDNIEIINNKINTVLIPEKARGIVKTSVKKLNNIISGDFLKIK